jgi:hypothetical protein
MGVWVAAAPGCLELNPSFVDEGGSGTEGPADDTAATMAAGSDGGTPSASDASDASTEPAAETGAIDCSPDAFEPSSYEEPADLAGMPPVSARLEGVDAEDWYKAPLDPAGPAEVFARTPDVDLNVCVFVECDGGTAGAITKCAGEPAVNPAWLTGCCDISSVGLEYDCGGPTNIVVHVRVDDGDDTCPAYGLELGFTPLG